MNSIYVHHSPRAKPINRIAAPANEDKSLRKRSGRSTGSLGALYAHAIALEQDSESRYRELAQDMADRGHVRLSELFEQLGSLESEQMLHWVRQSMGIEIPIIETSDSWFGLGADEPAQQFVKRMMTPRIALTLALSAERRAKEFFSQIAADCRHAAVRELAAQTVCRRDQHFELINSALARLPKPLTESGDVLCLAVVSQEM